VVSQHSEVDLNDDGWWCVKESARGDVDWILLYSFEIGLILVRLYVCVVVMCVMILEDVLYGLGGCGFEVEVEG